MSFRKLTTALAWVCLEHGYRKILTHPNSDTATLSTLLGWQRMRLTEVGTPVTSSDGYNAELRDDNSSTDGGSDFLRGLDTEANVALRVTNDDDGLEAGTLTGTGLFLYRLDL